MKVLLMNPGEEISDIEIEKNLDTYQKIVGGYIETAYYWDTPICLVCNDEGKINGMQLNRAVYDDNGEIIDIIAGPAFLVGVAEDDFCDFPEDIKEEFLEKFKYPERFFKTLDGGIEGIKYVPYGSEEKN